MTFAQLAAIKVAAPAQIDHCEACENRRTASGKDEFPFRRAMQAYLWVLLLINALASDDEPRSGDC